MRLPEDRIVLNSLRMASGFVFSRHNIISFEMPSIPDDFDGRRMYDAFSSSSDVIS